MIKKLGSFIYKRNIKSEEYCDNEYKVDIESEDKDSLYGIINGEKFIVHNINLILLQKVEIKNNMKILDYGSAKGLF